MAAHPTFRTASVLLAASAMTLSTVTVATASHSTQAPAGQTSKAAAQTKERPKPVLVPLAKKRPGTKTIEATTTDVAPGLKKTTAAHSAKGKKPKPVDGKKTKALLERPSSVGLLVNTWQVGSKTYHGLCTASVVRAKNDSVLVTAASCWLQNFGSKRLAPISSTFYPGSGGLDTAGAPHAPRGSWKVHSAVVPQNWVKDSKSTKHDQAFLVVEENSKGQRIGQTGPANAIAVDKKNGQRDVTILGYPKTFDNVMTHCAGNSRGYDTLSPRLTAMRCLGLGAGSIGGPWIMHDGRLGNAGFIMGVTEYSDSNGFVVSEPFTMAMAPHYDLAAAQKPRKNKRNS